jgi:hypothetical protein
MAEGGVAEVGGLFGDDDAFDSVAKIKGVEIDHEADFESTQSEQRVEAFFLPLAEGGVGLGEGLDVEDDEFFDDEVKAEGFANTAAFVLDVDGGRSIKKDLPHG